jgi:hypothetical protein
MKWAPYTIRFADLQSKKMPYPIDSIILLSQKLISTYRFEKVTLVL